MLTRSRVFLLASAAVTVVGVACSDATGPRHHISVHNGLRDVIRVSGDGGRTLATLFAGDRQDVAVSDSARALSWTFAQGQRARVQLGGDTIVLTDTTSAIDITNVVHGERFFLLHVGNYTAVPLGLGVERGGLTFCRGVAQPTALGGGADWGYWPLDSGFELRYYPADATCTGDFGAFSSADILRFFDARTGIATLLVTTLP